MCIEQEADFSLVMFIERYTSLQDELNVVHPHLSIIEGNLAHVKALIQDEIAQSFWYGCGT